MSDDPDYRRRLDDKLIGFLASHETWMASDTAWKVRNDARLDAHGDRLKSLEKWRTYLAGAWAVVVGGWYFLTGHK